MSINPKYISIAILLYFLAGAVVIAVTHLVSAISQQVMEIPWYFTPVDFFIGLFI